MPALITLVPNSAVHFWDTVLDIEHLPNRRRAFWDKPLSAVPDGSGRVPAELRPLVEDRDTRELTDPLSGRRPPEEQTYVLGRGQALEPFLVKWVPLPYFLVRGRRPDGRDDLAQGPTNWVRARLVALPDPEPGHTHHLTLAFDSTLMEDADGPSLAPTPGNAERQDEFAFTANAADSNFFLSQGWVQEWLEAMLRELRLAKRGGRPLGPDDERHACEHLARYMLFLDLLAEADILPRVRLLDTVSGNVGYDPVAVDLVLDIGNARTCGLLVEEHPGQGMNLTDSYPLALRDLGRPELTYGRPFDSRVEFARASFGRDEISRRSGRSNAFAWPNPMRVGPEAVQTGGGATGQRGRHGPVFAETLPLGRAADDPGLALQWSCRRRCHQRSAGQRALHEVRLGRRHGPGRSGQRQAGFAAALFSQRTLHLHDGGDPLAGALPDERAEHAGGATRR